MNNESTAYADLPFKESAETFVDMYNGFRVIYFDSHVFHIKFNEYSAQRDVLRTKMFIQTAIEDDIVHEEILKF